MIVYGIREILLEENRDYGETIGPFTSPTEAEEWMAKYPNLGKWAQGWGEASVIAADVDSIDGGKYFDTTPAEYAEEQENNA